jgi:hypothetical protein
MQRNMLLLYLLPLLTQVKFTSRLVLKVNIVCGELRALTPSGTKNCLNNLYIFNCSESGEGIYYQS